MKRFGRGLAILAVTGLVTGPAFAQAPVVVVADAPVHAVPKDDVAAPPAASAVEAATVQPAAIQAAPAQAEKPAGLEKAAMSKPPAEPNAPPNTLNAQYAVASAPAPVAQPRQSKPEGPSVALAPSLIDAAGAFESYLRKTGAIDPKFKDGKAINKAVLTGSSYEIGQFQEGMTAYAALAALQEPAFVQGVYDLGHDSGDREAVAASLLSDPKAVLSIDGARTAAASVSDILSHMGADMVRAGQGVKQSAYDVQRQAWSKEAAPDPQQQLAASKAISTVKTALNVADTDALIQSVVGLRKAGGSVGGRVREPSPVVVRGLAVAALAVLGRAGEEDAAKLDVLLDDAKSADCMKMAKLNLYQCLAVAGPHYEHVFCLGQHAMMDTGQCVISASGQSPIPEGGLQKVAATAKPSRSVSVPIALPSTAGPERARAYQRPSADFQVPIDAPPPAPPQPSDTLATLPNAYRDERADVAQAPAPRESARDDDDRYEEREPPARYRRAQRDDRYDDRYDEPYDRYSARDRSPWDAPQDYDPYVNRYPPGYAYGFGR